MLTPGMRPTETHRGLTSVSRGGALGRGKTSAVGDDPKSRGERLHLCLKGVQTPRATKNEDERLSSLTAFKVMERCFVDLRSVDLGATCRFQQAHARRATGRIQQPLGECPRTLLLMLVD
jgi:hypothetical protein